METKNRNMSFEKPSEDLKAENRNLYFIMNSNPAGNSLPGDSSFNEFDRMQRQNRYSFVVDWQISDGK